MTRQSHLHNFNFMDKLGELDLLVDELMKDQPDEKLVRQLMLRVGVPYSKDPIERVNRVLLKMHPPLPEDEREPQL